jgi:hypothetical protein
MKMGMHVARLRAAVKPSTAMGGGETGKLGKKPSRQALAVLQHKDRLVCGLCHHGCEIAEIGGGGNGGGLGV